MVKIDFSGFMLALKDLKDETYEQVIDHCTEEIEQSGMHMNEAKLLRGTFYILSKQPNQAFQDFNQIIEDNEADVSLRVNALIKRASLYIQQCKDPMKDPDLSFADFKQGQELDENNADIYHHRGQVSSYREIRSSLIGKRFRFFFFRNLNFEKEAIELALPCLYRYMILNLI